MNACSLQASHRKKHRKGGSAVKLWTCHTEKLEALCRPRVASMLRVRPIVLSPAAMRLTCESHKTADSSICAAQSTGLDGLDFCLLLAARAAAGRPSPSRFSVIAVASFGVWPSVEANGRNELQ